MNGQETYLKDFTIDQYYWDFGDGFRASGSDVKHNYVFPGTFNLTLGVTDKKDDKNDPERTSCITRKIIVISPQK
jgi:PKD repeat protein